MFHLDSAKQLTCRTLVYLLEREFRYRDLTTKKRRRGGPCELDETRDADPPCVPHSTPAEALCGWNQRVYNLSRNYRDFLVFLLLFTHTQASPSSEFSIASQVSKHLYNQGKWHWCLMSPSPHWWHCGWPSLNGTDPHTTLTPYLAPSDTQSDTSLGMEVSCPQGTLYLTHIQANVSSLISQHILQQELPFLKCLSSIKI